MQQECSSTSSVLRGNVMFRFVLTEALAARMFLVLTLPWLISCQEPEAVHIINGCLAPGIEQVRSTGKSIEVTCSFSTTTLLIALPNAKPSQTELAELGLTEDAAAAIRASTMTGNRWCTIVVLKPKSEFAKPGGDIACISTEVTIEKPLSAKGQSVLFQLVSSGKTEVSLKQLRSAD